MSDSNRIAFCVTCLVDQIYPEIGVAAIKLLRRAGYEVDFPQAQTCCGQPFFNSGFRSEAERLARRMVDIFADYEAVVLPSGSCTTMIRQEIPHLLQDAPAYHYGARRLAGKTFELTEFLAHRTDWQPASTSREATAKITYHDSCHMCRILGLKEEPRKLLQQAGCRITEMAESDRCCGFGGLFSLRMPEVSNAMTAEKLQQAVDIEAETVVTADPGCLMQMRGLAHEENVQVAHIATVLEEATR